MTRSSHGDFWLRVIILFKVVKAVVLIALGVCALVFTKNQIYVEAEKLVSWIGITAGRATIRHLLRISDTRVVLIGIGSLIYAGIFVFEAWFLHKRKAWAEWFTVGVTASLIPFEVYELVHHPTAGKIVTLVGNVLIVIYLVVRRLRDR